MMAIFPWAPLSMPSRPLPFVKPPSLRMMMLFMNRPHKGGWSHLISQRRKGSCNVSSAEVDAASRKSDSWKMNLCVFVFGLALPHTPTHDRLSLGIFF